MGRPQPRKLDPRSVKASFPTLKVGKEAFTDRMPAPGVGTWNDFGPAAAFHPDFIGPCPPASYRGRRPVPTAAR